MKKIILALLVLFYIVSPIDLIPDFLRPLGFLDDLLFLCLYLFLKNKKSAPFFFRDRQSPPPNEDNSKTESKKEQSPWEILGVTKNASPEEIKTAYRQRSQEYHPDKVQHLGKDLRALADKKFREIQKAFETLQK
jgi:DnaJ like chaperone protein